MSEIDFERMASRLLKRNGVDVSEIHYANDLKRDLKIISLKRFLTDAESFRLRYGDILLKEKYENDELVVSDKKASFWIEKYLEVISMNAVVEERSDISKALKPKEEMGKKMVSKKSFTAEDVRKIVQADKKKEKKKIKKVVSNSVIISEQDKIISEQKKDEKIGKVFSHAKRVDSIDNVKTEENDYVSPERAIELLGEIRRDGGQEDSGIVLETVVVPFEAKKKLEKIKRKRGRPRKVDLRQENIPLFIKNEVDEIPSKIKTIETVEKTPFIKDIKVVASLMQDGLDQLYYPEFIGGMPRLRPYQYDKLIAMVDMLGAQTMKEFQTKPVIIDITPTRGGKTVMEATLAKLCVDLGIDVIFATSSNLIIEGEKGALYEFQRFLQDEDIGVINTGNKDFGKKCTLINYKSLAQPDVQDRLLDDKPKMLILDEGDLSQTELRQAFVRKMQERKELSMITAFTATPEIANKFLGDIGRFSDVMHLWELQQLKYIKHIRGWYVDVDLEIHPDYLSKSGKFDFDLLKDANKQRLITLPAEIYKGFHWGQQMLVATNTIEQAEKTAEDMREKLGEFIRVEAIHTDMQPGKRLESFNDYLNKDVNVLVGVGLFGRGLTEGGITESMVLAFLSASRTRVYQTMGRAIGYNPDYPTADIYQIFPSKITSHYKPATIEDVLLPTTEIASKNKRHLEKTGHGVEFIGKKDIANKNPEEENIPTVSFMSRETIQLVMNSRENHWTTRLVEEQFFETLEKFEKEETLGMNTKVEVEWAERKKEISWSVFRQACIRCCVPNLHVRAVMGYMKVAKKIIDFWKENKQAPDQEMVQEWIEVDEVSRKLMKDYSLEELKIFFEEFYKDGKWEKYIEVEVDGKKIPFTSPKFRMAIIGKLYPESSYKEKLELSSVLAGEKIIVQYFSTGEIMTVEEALEIMEKGREYRDQYPERKKAIQKVVRENKEKQQKRTKIVVKNLSILIAKLEELYGKGGKLPARELDISFEIEGESFTWPEIRALITHYYFSTTHTDLPGLQKEMVYSTIENGKTLSAKEAAKVRIQYLEALESNRKPSQNQLLENFGLILNTIEKELGSIRSFISQARKVKKPVPITVKIDKKKYEIDKTWFNRAVLVAFFGEAPVKWDRAMDLVAYICIRFKETGKFPEMEELPLKDNGYLTDEALDKLETKETLTNKQFEKYALEIFQQFEKKYGVPIEMIPFSDEPRILIKLDDKVYSLGLIGLMRRIHKTTVGDNKSYSFKNSKKFFIGGSILWKKNGVPPSYEETREESLCELGLNRNAFIIATKMREYGIDTHDSATRLWAKVAGYNPKLTELELQVLSDLSENDVGDLRQLAIKFNPEKDIDATEALIDPAPISLEKEIDEIGKLIAKICELGVEIDEVQIAVNAIKNGVSHFTEITSPNENINITASRRLWVFMNQMRDLTVKAKEDLLFQACEKLGWI